MDLTSAVWRKSVRSGNNGGACVEVAVVRGREADVANKSSEEFVVVVRDTKNRDREPNVFTISEWDAFIADAKDGHFDAARLIDEHLTVPAV